MSILSSLNGHLQLEITSADPEALLSHLTEAGAVIHDIQKISDLTVRFTISIKDHPTTKKLCEHHGAKMRPLRKTGLYWSMHHVLCRPMLIFGILLSFCFCLFLPTRVFFVRVKGNDRLPTRKIQHAAQESGIGFGTSRRAVRSEKVKNALLSNLPELEWVGVNTTGCVAEISVRERAEPETDEQNHQVSHIAAAHDGYLLSVTVTSGNPLCTPGQQVKKGQILVSGYTDCGIIIQGTYSEGEILAQTKRDLAVITPTQGYQRGDETGRSHKFSLLIGKKRINLWKGSGISDTTCGRIYEEKYTALPGGFILPLALCIETYINYETQSASIASPDALSSFAQKYLSQQMTAGKILTKEETVTEETGIIRLDGSYTCQEMIGRVQSEQIGDESWQNPQNGS